MLGDPAVDIHADQGGDEPAEPKGRSWHDRTAQQVAERLEVDPSEGLTDPEVERRREEHGTNTIRRVKRRSVWRILLDQFTNLVVLLLLGAAITSAVLGNLLEGAAIAVALVINAGIGFVTELRAARSMEALRELGQAEACVLRDGQEQEILVDEIVPGDVVLLDEGDVVPADGRIVHGESLECDESALTGESVPVPKSEEPAEADAPLADRTSMTYRGTTVTRGKARIVIVGIGMDTELGRIASMVEEADPDATPLEKRLDRLAHRLLWVALGVGVVLAAVGVLAGREPRAMIETAIIMAIAAIPEGLPIVATLALARGVWRMARRKALVNRLSSVETLGATSVILSDKTGTLTENRMSVSRLGLAGAGQVVVEHDGPELVLQGEQGQAVPSEDEDVQRLVRVIVLCNGASLGDEDEQPHGDPTELALLELGRELGVLRDELLSELPLVREESFCSETTMMATFHRAEGELLVAVKGAPEAVLSCCTRLRQAQGEVELSDEQRERWRERNEALAADGLRVLAVASKRVDDESAEPYEGLTFLGLIALRDPPRREAGPALRRCREAGVRVVLVTGDQPATASAIAGELEISSEGAREVLGSELSEVLGEGPKALREVSVFARVSPEQKLELVEAYQQAGEVVGMTGDGVNDAPALKKADIGIAMGERGTEAAREASDIVLEDDSFGTIVEAIAQGRTIFENIRRFIIYLLSGNLGEILAVGVASLLGVPLPLLPLQILFINLLFDVFPALALGLGAGNTEAVMQQAPRAADEPLLTRRHWGLVTGYGLLIGGSVLCVFAVGLLVLEVGSDRAVTISFLAFGLARLLHVFNMRDNRVPLWRSDVVRSRYVWGAVAVCAALLTAAVFVPSLSLVLGVAALSPVDWALVALGGGVPLVVGQLGIAGARALRSRSSSSEDEAR